MTKSTLTLRALLALPFILLVACAPKHETTGKSSEQYAQALNEVRNKIVTNNLMANTICKGHLAIWYQATKPPQTMTIEKALEQSKMIAGSKTKDLSNSVDYAKKLLSELRNPPLEFKQAFDLTLDALAKLESMESLAVNPNGSLLSYNRKVKTTQNELSETIRKLKVVLP